MISKIESEAVKIEKENGELRSARAEIGKRVSQLQAELQQKEENIFKMQFVIKEAEMKAMVSSD